MSCFSYRPALVVRGLIRIPDTFDPSRVWYERELSGLTPSKTAISDEYHVRLQVHRFEETPGNHIFLFGNDGVTRLQVYHQELGQASFLLSEEEAAFLTSFLPDYVDIRFLTRIVNEQYFQACGRSADELCSALGKEESGLLPFLIRVCAYMKKIGGVPYAALEELPAYGRADADSYGRDDAAQPRVS